MINIEYGDRRKGMCKGKNFVSMGIPIIFIFLFFLVSSAFAGIPEPGIILYGQVRDPNGTLLTNGELLWTLIPVEGGDPVIVSTSLNEYVEPEGTFSYTVMIPLELEIPEFPVSENKIPLTETPVAYTRTAEVLGTAISMTDSVYISIGDKGTSHYIPIGVSPTDTDADGLLDEWEKQIVDADPYDDINSNNDVHPNDDFDGDGWSNLKEYQAGTDPTDKDDHPEDQTFIEDFETGDFTRFPWVLTDYDQWSVTSDNSHEGSYAAETPLIGDEESASMEVTIYCDEGEVSFWYAASTEEDYDFLYFSIDDVEQGAFSGEVPYTQATFAVLAGRHTFKWVYAKDKTGSVGLDKVWIDDIIFPGSPDSDYDGMCDQWEIENGLDPLFNDALEDPDEDGYNNLREYLADTNPQDGNDFPVAVPVLEDFELGDLSRLPWTTQGDSQWSVTSAKPHNGNYSAEAPALGDNESSLLEVTMHCEKGELSFWYAVSSEENYDFLRFYLDDIDQGAWSGEISYTKATFQVTSGKHTFRWVYAKDKADSSGSDTAWLDDISFPGSIDSDYDGMPDEWEIANALNPLFNDASLDDDGDFFTNFQEYQADTDPQDKTSFPAGDIPQTVMNLSAGWNMISLPLEPSGKKLSDVFPKAVVVYCYKKDQGYVQVTREQDLEVGSGYWLLLNEFQDRIIIGQPFQSYNLPISEDGWQMIGGCSSHAQALGDKCSIGVVYGYEKGVGYKRVPDAKNLEPGRGYWILLNNINEQSELRVENMESQ